MDFISEDSIFEVLNDNHEYFLDTPDVSFLNFDISPLLSPRSITEEKFDYSDILNDNHELYLDTSDLLSEFSCRSSTKSSNYNEKSFAFSSEDHLEYLTFIQKEYETQNKAARKIQNYWRSYYQKQVFLKIKKLILKYSNSDPAVALRIVNPKEAVFLDKASGTFLKFKLAGTKFPPKIVYKIVSRTPIIKVDTTFSQRMDKATMTNVDKIIEKYTGKARVKNTKNEERNDWRPYTDDTLRCNKRKNYYQNQNHQISGKSKSCARQCRPKSLDRKLNELSWIKSQYGV